MQIRVGAICVTDGHVLLQRVAGGEVWFVPGGRVQPGEPARQALARELREELGVSCSPGRLCAVIENAFVHEATCVHEVGLYFPVELETTEIPDWFVDAGTRLQCRWVALGDLENIQIRPEGVDEVLRGGGAGVDHVVTGLPR